MALSHDRQKEELFFIFIHASPSISVPYVSSSQGLPFTPQAFWKSAPSEEEATTDYDFS